MRLVAAPLVLLCLGALECSSSSSSTTAPPPPPPPPATTGSLTVTMYAPSEVTPKVTVTGPGGYSQALSATRTLTGLAPGRYAVSGKTDTSADPIAPSIDTASLTGSPATVAAGDTAKAIVTYAPRPGTGGLWVADANTPRIAEYTASQLTKSTSSRPAVAFPSAVIGIAFDANGNLWATNGNGVVEYDVTNGQPMVTLTIDNSQTQTPGSVSLVALAFSYTGDLWAADNANNAVWALAAGRLAGPSGSVQPFGALNAGVMNPGGLAFDASGDLWVSNVTANTLSFFGVVTLDFLLPPTPNVTISATLFGSLSAPTALAFDKAGNLWVADMLSNLLVSYTSGRIQQTGSPTPTIALGAVNQSIAYPRGLAFDASGNLWVANVATGTIVEFTASQIAAGGNPVPNVTIKLAGGQPTALAFNPYASGLPLH